MNNNSFKADMLFQLAEARWGNVKRDGDYVEINIHSNVYDTHPFTLSYNMGEDGDYADYSEAEKAELILESIKAAYQDFDVSAETYKLLDENGHGIEGEPYEMCDVYKAQENVQVMIECTYDILSDIYYNGDIEKEIDKCKNMLCLSNREYIKNKRTKNEPVKE